jgi:hypothetical protein
MRRSLSTAVLFVGFALTACNTADTTREQAVQNAGCTVNGVDPRACDPADTKKTTVCHIPPGNPGNAHTICVGNAAVPAHLDHGDFVGTCVCDTEPDAGTGGGGDDAGSGGGGGGDDGGVVTIIN